MTELIFARRLCQRVAAALTTLMLPLAAMAGLPHAADDFATTPEETAVSINVLSNDFDTDADETLTVIFFATPSQGTVSNNNGTLTYTPPTNFVGTVAFNYTITDGANHFDHATVTVTVTGVNDAPVARDDIFVFGEDAGEQTLAVLNNDEEVDGDTLIIQTFTTPGSGQLQNNGDGTFTYSSNLNFTGTDSFTYTITDGQGSTDTATVNLVINSTNDTPTAANMSVAANSNDDDLRIPLADLFDDVEDSAAAMSYAIISNSNEALFDAVSIDTGTATSGGARIVGGQDAAAGAWPWAVALVNSSQPDALLGQFCGGALVAPNLVVTAAHCVDGMTAGDIDVLVGRRVLSSNEGSRIPVASITMHANYNPTTLENDIAILTLASSSNEETLPIITSSSESLAAPGTLATVLGWGLTVEGGTSASDVLQQVDVPIVANSVANATAALAGAVTDNMIAAGFAEGGRDACQGDSGGPLVVPDGNGGWLLAGVVSFGIGCGQPDSYGVYTRVANYADDFIPGSAARSDETPALVLDFRPLAAGVADIVVEATDTGGLTVQSTVTVTLTAVDDPPSASGIADVSVTEDAAQTSIALFDAFDDLEDADADLTYTITGNSNPVLFADGFPVIQNDPEELTLQFRPDQNGSATLTIQATDTAAQTVSTSFTVTVTAANDSPTSNGFAAVDVAAEADDVLIDLFGVFDDVDDSDDTLSFAIVGNNNPDVATLGFEGTPTQLLRIDPNNDIVDGVHVASVLVRATDPVGASVEATLTITLTQENQTPTATDDTVFVDEDTVLTFDVLANDADADGDSLRFVSFTQPANGLVKLVGEQLSYTPNANFSGSDSFTYTITDGNGETSNGTVNLTVQADNDAPTATNDFVNTTEDNAVTLSTLLDNDNDPDGDALSISAFTDGTLGRVSAGAGNDLLYTPNENANGTDTFTYTVSDSQGATAMGTVTVVIDPVNDAPIGGSYFAATVEDVPVVVTVLTDDVDPDGDTLLLFDFVDAANGMVTLGIDGLVVYTPNANFNGADSFTYTVIDGNGGQDTATVNINVIAFNDGPTAVDDSGTTAEDSPVNVTVTANDNDDDGTVVVATVAIIQAPANGTAAANGDGTVTYTPNDDFNGDDTFTYLVEDNDGTPSNVATVTITVTPVNDGPAAADDAFTTVEDTATVVNVLANDTDDGTIDSATVAISGAPNNGTATVLGDGTIRYVPNAGYFGLDQFQYSVDDNDGVTSNDATVTMTVTSAADPPTVADRTANTAEDSPVNIDVTTTTTAGDGAIVYSTLTLSTPSNGTATDDDNGIITYTPAANFFGSDQFTYTVGDDQGNVSAAATVTVTVTAADDPPVAVADNANTAEDTAVLIAVSGNDSDDGQLDVSSIAITSAAQNGTTAIIGDGTVRYTPNAGYFGFDEFAYTIDDDTGNSSAAATVSITIASGGDAPTAANRDATVSEDGAVNIDITGDVTPGDGTIQFASLIITSGPSNGTATDNDSGVITYSPTADFFGSDSFTYTVSDDHGNTSNAATVTVTVTPSNDPPLTTDDSVTTNEDSAVLINVLGNDNDDDAINPATTTVTMNPTSGTATAQGDGQIRYVPNAGFFGIDSFEYTVDDNDGATSMAATVNVTVTSVADGPTAADRAVVVVEDNAIPIDLTGDVTAGDAAVAFSTLQIQSGPSNGSAVSNGAGTVTYTPNNNHAGDDAFSYTVADALGNVSNTATVSITITPQNDPPNVVNDDVVATDGIALTIDALDNDDDPDGDALVIVALTQPGQGAAEIVNGSSLSYRADDGATGADSFTYTVSDSNGGSTVGTVNVQIFTNNATPVANPDSYSMHAGNLTLTVAASGVLANDNDVDTAASDLQAVLSTGPSKGTVTLNADGSFVYQAAASYDGSDSFEYVVTDGASNSAVATVSISGIAPGAGDFDADDDIDQDDLDLFLPHFGEVSTDAGFDPMFDLDENDVIDFDDLSILVGLIETGGGSRSVESSDAAPSVTVSLEGPDEVHVGDVFPVTVMVTAHGAGFRGGPLGLEVRGATVISDTVEEVIQAPFDGIQNNGLATGSGFAALGGVSISNDLGIAVPIAYAVLMLQADEVGPVEVEASIGDSGLILAPPFGQLDPSQCVVANVFEVDVVAVNDGPTITFVGDPITLALNASPDLLAGVTAVDPVDGDVTHTVSVDSGLEPGVVGTYTVWYEATNSAGHSSRRSRTYHVEAGWEFPIAMNGTAVDLLSMGMANGATDDVDVGVDVVSEGSAAVLANQLSRDMRGLSDSAEWTVEIHEDGDLLWRSELAPPGVLRLERLTSEGDAIAGTSINMHAQSTWPVLAGERYRVGYQSDAAEFVLTLEPGWNVLSFPIAPTLSTPAALFGDLVSRDIWEWDGQRYRRTQHFVPGKGYFVHRDGPAVTITVSGRAPATTRLTLKPGWSLIGGFGSAADGIALAADDSTLASLATVASWNGADFVANVEGLTYGRGYWVYSIRRTVLEFAP